jgi:hypothetical protein
MKVHLMVFDGNRCLDRNSSSYLKYLGMRPWLLLIIPWYSSQPRI